MGGRDDRDASGRPTMLQGPSRGLCSAQTSGSPMTLSSATAAGSAPKAGVNLECVEAGPSIPAPGSARVVAPALGAPNNAISNPNPKQTQRGNDCRFYPDLLRAACHYCDHLPGDTQLQVIITRFPINSDGRITVPESELCPSQIPEEYCHCRDQSKRGSCRQYTAGRCN